jgi:hypothetical protein
MIHTYYYGVICVYCQKFIMLNDYQTTLQTGVVDVSLEGLPLKCPHCSTACGYTSDHVVYSQSRDELVPLDRDIR